MPGWRVGGRAGWAGRFMEELLTLQVYGGMLLGFIRCRTRFWVTKSWQVALMVVGDLCSFVLRTRFPAA